MRAIQGLSAVGLAALVASFGHWSASATETDGVRPIGSVAAANEAVIGTPPAQEPRNLRLGLKLFESEKVETSAVGAGQFLFLDQTSLTVWPNSDIVLDKYIYDPDKGTGEMALSATRGVLRFIGGRISKQADVTVQTPHGTVAIRGGMAQISVTPDRTKVTNIASEYVRLTTNAGRLTLSRPMAAAESSSGDSAPTFAGVGGADAAAELYSTPPGEGDGGVSAPVTDEKVSDASNATGMGAVGSGDRSASQSGPVSTRGEREVDSQQVIHVVTVEETANAVVDANQPKPEPPAVVVVPDPPVVVPDPDPPVVVFPDPPIVVPDPDPPVVVVPDPDPPVVVPDPDPPVVVVPDPDPPVVVPDPDPPVVILPDPDPTPTPEVIPVEAGSIITAEDSSGGNLLFLVGAQRTQLVGATRTQVGDDSIVTATAEDGTTLSFIEVEGLSFRPGAGSLGGRPADIVSFIDPDVFYLTALRTAGGDAGGLVAQLDADPVALALNFVGDPTPRAVWSTATGPDIAVRHYQMTSELFSLGASPLPARLGEPISGAGFGGLFLIGDAAGPLIPAFDPVAGPDTPSSSKWLMGWLSVEGEGAEQKAAFGAMTARAQPTEAGQPVASGAFLLMAKMDAASAPAFGLLPLGTLGDESGQTAFGPNGEYLIFAAGGAYAADANPDFDATPGAFSQWTSSDVATEAFGNTRLATLDAHTTLAEDDRLQLAAQLVATSVDQPTPLPIEAAFTGGFASAIGQTFTPSKDAGERLSAPYLLSSAIFTDVIVGFDRDTNAVVAEFSGMEAAAGTPTDVAAVNLNWGDSGGQSAFADENRFAAQDAFKSTGGVTGQPQSLSGRTGAPSTDVGGVERQNGFRGVMAVSGLTGDGGIFPDGVDATPEYLRWGWWAGEYRQDPNDPDAAFAGRTDRFFPGAWVAGVATDIASVRAATGQASYDGFALGHVVETSAQGVAAYVEGGSFNMQYNFGSDTGLVRIDGIAGETLQSNVFQFQSAGENHYGGALTGFKGAGAGSVGGAFYTGAGDKTAATAGRFDFAATTPDGKNNVVVGIFGADKQ